MKGKELLRKAEEAYLSVEDCKKHGNIPQVIFDKKEGEFHVFEHSDSSSYVPLGEDDMSVSMYEIECRIPSYCPSKEEMASAIVDFLKEEGVRIEDK